LVASSDRLVGVESAGGVWSSIGGTGLGDPDVLKAWTATRTAVARATSVSTMRRLTRNRVTGPEKRTVSAP